MNENTQSEQEWMKIQSELRADMVLIRRDWEQQPIIERLDKIIELLGGKAEPVVVGIVGKTEEPRTVCDHKEDMIRVNKSFAELEYAQRHNLLYFNFSDECNYKYWFICQSCRTIINTDSTLMHLRY